MLFFFSTPVLPLDNSPDYRYNDFALEWISPVI